MSATLFISYENFLKVGNFTLHSGSVGLYNLQAKAQNLKGTEATGINLTTVNL